MRQQLSHALRLQVVRELLVKDLLHVIERDRPVQLLVQVPRQLPNLAPVLLVSTSYLDQLLLGEGL